MLRDKLKVFVSRISPPLATGAATHFVCFSANLVIPENIARNNVSATIFPSLAGPRAINWIMAIYKPRVTHGLKPFCRLKSEVINVTRAWDKEKI